MCLHKLDQQGGLFLFLSNSFFIDLLIGYFTGEGLEAHLAPVGQKGEIEISKEGHCRAGSTFSFFNMSNEIWYVMENDLKRNSMLSM